MKEIKYDRHAKRRMKERGVAEEEVEVDIADPDFSEASVKGRMNSIKYVNERHVRVTWKEESDYRLVITVTIRKKSFKE